MTRISSARYVFFCISFFFFTFTNIYFQKIIYVYCQYQHHHHRRSTMLPRWRRQWGTGLETTRLEPCVCFLFSATTTPKDGARDVSPRAPWVFFSPQRRRMGLETTCLEPQVCIIFFSSHFTNLHLQKAIRLLPAPSPADSPLSLYHQTTAMTMMKDGRGWRCFSFFSPQRWRRRSWKDWARDFILITTSKS